MKVKKNLFVRLLGAFMIGAVLFATNAYAVEPGIYEAYMTAHYAHPETGEVEDSGGKKSMAIGQGMCEGATSRDALIEKAANGQMYATVRYVLMDAVEGAEFRVNGTAVSSEVTQKKGQEWDFRIPIPDENCVVRGNMYVQPMGRDVVFYMTFSDLKEGHGDFVTKISEEDLDPLFEEKNKAAQQISELEYLSDDEESAFRAEIDKCDAQEGIDQVIVKAKEADEAALKQLELGKAKSEALKKIDALDKLNANEIKSFRDTVKAAESIDDVNKILGKAEFANNKMFVYIGVGVVVVAVAAFVVMKKKKSTSKDEDSSLGDEKSDEKE